MLTNREGFVFDVLKPSLSLFSTLLHSSDVKMVGDVSLGLGYLLMHHEWRTEDEGENIVAKVRKKKS